MTEFEAPQPAAQYFNGPNGRLAYRKLDGTQPTLVWLAGLQSDMLGGKALRCAQLAEEMGTSCLRFDYSGHGESDGDFAEGCISDWAADAAAIITALTEGPLILIGSSMGGWISCLMAHQFAERIAGAVLIAPAPDFTKELMEPSLDDAARTALARTGRIETPSEDGGPPRLITKKLLDDGASNLVLGGIPIPIRGPVQILQGAADDVVPPAHAMRLIDRLESPDIDFTLVKGGDHRLSEPRDLDRLDRAIRTILSQIP